VRHQNAGLAGNASVSIGGMSGYLFMAGCDELDLGASAKRIQKRDNSVAAKAENRVDPNLFEVFDEQKGS
jgi:hypothetical protein